MYTLKRLFAPGVPVLLASAIVLTAQSAQAAPSRTVFSNSFKPLVSEARVLGAADAQAGVKFQLALKMRDFAGLERRIAAGEVIAPAELEAKYYPLAADYRTLTDWVRSQGLTVERTYNNRLTLEVRGSVAQVRSALGVDFVRIQFRGQPFISTRTAPSLPAGFERFVLSFSGLQPANEWLVPLISDGTPIPNSPTSPFKPPYSTNDLLTAYSANNLAYNGAGQKIAILGSLFAKDSDLTSFWSANGVPQSSANVEKVAVSSNIPNPRCTRSISSTNCTYLSEANLDAEWASGTATGAVIRQYAVGIPAQISSFISLFSTGLQAIINDLPSQPTLRVLTISYGYCESALPSSQLQSASQLFATLASQGVTTFTSSGDSGSTANGCSTTATQYFAVDPNLAGVGGTSLRLNTNGTISSETAWSGSGGGLSTIYTRPSWQVGSGVPSGTARAVPDVALVADPNTGAYTVVGGKTYQFGGTSLSSPIWAGYAAIINQGRAAAGKGSLGLLGPRVYPLLGTSNFRDITSGSIGAYSAGPGYDLATGIGVPVVNQLLNTLVSAP
ncbi:S53 family peptidase [Gloeobacter kilaueensis]|uniref:Peptidase S53 propeptide n=1 Tax=Gloeobacter kilaueensis (strain ATCC BAA-2537 / CCAP 1431/1 / ULC 316 / JS1) TaxID=1183438 RepID=U5QGS8_GLOK1|nr:S53 family peptidase [Gloeobacter kilaueensis]AGY58187.1 peptidase S53 propeptide [Gloeobacter kilaueensis JS1]